MNFEPLSIAHDCDCGEKYVVPIVAGKFYKCASCVRRYISLKGQVIRNYIMVGKPQPSPELIPTLVPLYTEFETSYHELIFIDRSGMRDTLKSSRMIKKIIDLFFKINQISDSPFTAVHPYANKDLDGLSIFYSSVTMALKYEKAGVLLPGILNDYTRTFYNSLKASKR